MKKIRLINRKFVTLDPLIKEYLDIFQSYPPWIQESVRNDGLCVVKQYNDFNMCIENEPALALIVKVKYPQAYYIWLVLYFDHKHKHLILSSNPHLPSSRREKYLEKLDNAFKVVFMDQLFI